MHDICKLIPDLFQEPSPLLDRLMQGIYVINYCRGNINFLHANERAVISKASSFKACMQAVAFTFPAIYFFLLYIFRAYEC